ncbi:winged helix-turn-helix transcriptional regulator [Aeromicrobium sp. 9AM]|uniref:winged helix-turn-helix transcriptional regulator n=1 Tax=Aeromicrobium sp. 9AM TaxID=2653126 RepID=UPI00135B9715
MVAGASTAGQELASRLSKISDKVLNDRLGQLVSDGLLRRQRCSGYPSTTVYEMTERGRLLRPLLIELYRTGSASHQDCVTSKAGREGLVAIDDQGVHDASRRLETIDRF